MLEAKVGGDPLSNVFRQLNSCKHLHIIFGVAPVFRQKRTSFSWQVHSYTDRLRDFSVITPIYTLELLACRISPLTYDLNGFKTRVNRHNFSLAFF